jgi:hypothetical protein
MVAQAIVKQPRTMRVADWPRSDVGLAGRVCLSLRAGFHQRAEQGVAPGVYKSPFPSLDSPYSISSASTIDSSHASAAARNNAVRHDTTI